MSTTTFNSIGDRVNITGLLAAPDSSWHSLDLSAYIPAGATAAIVEIQNTGSSTAGVWGVRHPGSGIETGNFSYSTSRLFLLAPLDASRVTAYKRTSSAAIFYLHGWTMGGVTMLTNRVSIPAFPGPNYSWQPLDMSAYAPGATALIIEAYSTYPSAAEISFRAQGSSDPAHGAHLRYHGFWIVKANNGACEYEASAGYNQAYLVGYVTETENGGFSMRTNCLDISPANAGDSGVERQKSLDFQIPVGSEMTLHLVGSAGSNSRIRRDASMPADYNYTSANESIPVPSQPAQPFSVLVTFQDYRFATGRFLVQGWVAQVPWYLLHTSAATNIQAASFDGNANFTYGGNLGEIDQYGFEYGTSSGVYPNNVLESGPPPGSPYSLTIPNLSPSTWYFFRAKMHHPTYGWIYGEEFSLQTAFDPSLILFEKQNTSEISASNLFGANWKAQTFTPISGHLVQAVKLKLRLAGAPNGILEVSIKATSGGVPTGPDLAYGNMPCSMLSSMATVYSINLTLGAVLNGGTRYAVVVRATSQNVSNQVYWTQGLNVYANGQYIQSTDSGSTWPYISDVDLYFEEWGNAPVETYPATDIGAVQAVGNGFMTDPTNIDQIGFEWGTTPGGPYPDSVTDTSAPFFAGIFSLLMTGLSPATPYYYRAKIHHTTLGWIYGAEKTFTTTVGIPLTRTDPPSAATTVSIDAVGDILSTGSDPSCDRRGFVYGLSSHMDPGNVAPGVSGYDAFAEDSGSFGVGSFTKTLVGLTTSRIYYLRAYSHNSFGYAYGSELAALTSDTVNILYPVSDNSIGIRFDSSPGGGYPHPYGGSIPHHILCRAIDSVFVPGGIWGSVSGNFVYERNYYNDNFYTDLYNMLDPFKRMEGIVKVKWKANVLRNSYPYGKYKRQLNTHGTTYSGASLDIPYGGAMVCEIFYNNPNTGAPWALAETDALLAGISLGAEGGYGIACCDAVLVYVLWANAAVTTKPAQRLTSATAKLNGHVDEDEAEVCQVYFQWGETVAYGNTTPLQTKALGESFSADIVGLDPVKTYHTRAVIVTACGETFYGVDMLVGLSIGGGGNQADLLVKDTFI